VNNKIRKAERLAFITKALVENTSKIYTLNYFSEQLDSAKSTLSEDVDLISKLFKAMELGEIRSISGANGGIQYVPVLSREQIEKEQLSLCKELMDPKRIITGGYLYMNDIFYNPEALKKIAKILATHFVDCEIDYVATIETKGIPLATVLAELMNKPIIVVRKSARLTEGPTIQMNYLAGSTKTIKTMALPIRALERGSRVLFVDDFMKAGGTAKGVIDLLKEYQVTVAGVGVVMSTKEPVKKLVEDYYSIIELEDIDEETGEIKIYPKKANN